MFKTILSLFFINFVLIESKFYSGELLSPYRGYSTHEYDPDVGYPYGLSYKKYPDIPLDVSVSKVKEFEGPIPRALGYKYENVAGLEYPGKLGYENYYGGAHGYTGYPIGISKSIEYGYGPGPVIPQYSHQGLIPITHQGQVFYGAQAPYGIAQIDKGSFNNGKQNVIGEHYNHVQGQNGESLNHGDVGFNKGQVSHKDIKGDSVHFVDTQGINRGQIEGKNYHGGEHFGTEGKHGAEKFQSANHNKGHNIKGFKKSHHLDETGKTEEFFDEDHDTGGHHAFEGRFGKFGELGANSYKGGFNDGRFKTGEAKKEGHSGTQYFLDKAQGEHGNYGGNKFAENSEAYGLNKGFGEHGFSGHHGKSNIYKNHPVGYGSYF